MQTVTFGLLGPVEVHVDGRPLPLGGPHGQAVLAALLLDPNRVVPLARLVDAAWGDTPPPSARVQAQNRVSGLRRRLREAGAPEDVIGTRGSGYVARVEPGQLDVDAFEDQVLLPDGCADVEAAGRLAAALSLWRGPALDGLRTPLLAAAAQRLDERRLNVLCHRLELDLRLGRCHTVIGELVELTAGYPAQEQLAGQLMRALYLADRQREALAHFDKVRRALADELGIDPGPELCALRDRILRNDPALRQPAPAQRSAATRRAGAPVPRELPADVAGFVGRASQLAALDDLLDALESGAASAVVISAIGGTAGVGKTALAVHWGHRIADRFPDGQLYVNLRGYHSGAPMRPITALAQLLRSLGLPPNQVPTEVDEAAAKLRSLLAGRRTLLLLDNAASEDQVRPLLPGSPGCLVVVTSRSDLPGLVAAAGAYPLPLDLLGVDEARHLLERRLGTDRTAAAPDAVREIIARCARLPLALTVAAARAATRPEFGLDTLAGELRDEAGSLDPFASDDTATDIRAVFSWSYRALDEPVARLFRLLGLHAGADVDTTAVASLAGLPVRRTRQLLAALTNDHLLAEHSPGRYAMHDLLRAYAAELARAHVADEERDAALHRLLDHYVHTAHAAARLLSPHQAPIALAPARPGVTVGEIGEHGRALAWFNAERTTLLALLDQAAATGHDIHTWQLAWTIETFSDYRGHWHDQAAAWRTALAAAERLGDQSRQAHAHRCLALVLTRLRRYRDADGHLTRALDLYRGLGDRTGEAHVHRAFNWVFDRQDRHGEALGHAQQALALFRLAGDRYGQARALNSAGWDHTRLGEYREALDCCRQALAIHREIGDRYGEAATWDSLGYTHHHLGHHRLAIRFYQHALDLIQELGSRYNEALVLNHLGEAHCAAGDVGPARQAWQRALDILDDLEHLDAAEVRASLDRLGGTLPQA